MKMSWLKRDSPFRSSLRGKLAAGISAMSLNTPLTIHQQSGSSSTAQQIESSIEHDADACFDSFKNHWQQAWITMSRWQGPASASRSATMDQISFVLNHLDQLVSLLLHDLRRPNDNKDIMSIGPLLDLVLTEDILGRLLSWSLCTGEFVDALKLEQLKVYEALVAQSIDGRVELLVHKPILQPLLRLLSACGGRGAAPVELERRLVVLLNQLCVSLTRSPTLLEFFFSASADDDKSATGLKNFLIFSLLIPFVHREGAIGQQARDALLLCMSFSQEHESIGLYIAEHSTFCPVLATGLSGLYSLLPRKLAFEAASDWHCLTPDDVQELPELEMFLNSLEFCNAVIQVAHPLVQEQLLEYLNHGFLIPVLIPALQPSILQPCIGELTTATAYLDLFLKSVSEPMLLQAFLKMLLLELNDGPPVIHHLIRRIASQQPLSVVTLALFHTLVSLNCEDVMLELVFKHLIPCTHVMVSQRCRVREIDMFGKTAEKFLSLMPACCLPPSVDDDANQSGALDRDGPHSIPGTFPRNRRRLRNSSSSSSLGPCDSHLICVDGQSELQSSFLQYLLDAHHAISACAVACRCWTWPYDGEQPTSDSLVFQSKPEPSILSTTMKNGISTNNTNGDSEINDKFHFEKSASREEGANIEFQTTSSIKNLNILRNRTLNERRDAKSVSNASSHSVSVADGFGSPDLGSFLSILLTKLENMMSNSVYENLQLTGVISRLACYPQPLLRSFLLNHSLVFQPSVRSLLQVLGTLKQKLDSFFYTEDNVDDLILRAKRFLALRDERIVVDNGTTSRRSPIVKIDPRGTSMHSVAGRVQENKRRSISEMLFGKSNPLHGDRERSRSAVFDGIPNETGYRYVKAPTADSPEGKLESLRMKNAVLCMVILEEFLKELSAIAMEHAVVCDDDETDVEHVFQ